MSRAVLEQATHPRTRFKFKIYGGERSGTNFMVDLIRKNLADCTVYENVWGSKHLPVMGPSQMEDFSERYHIDPPPVMTPLIIIKNPYSWYSSIERWCKRQGRQFNMELEYCKYERLYYSLWRYETASHRYFNPPKMVTYEDLLRWPFPFLFKLGVPPAGDGGLIIPEKVNLSDQFTEDRKQYYLQGGTFGLPRGTVNKINDIVSWDLMEHYGYRRVEYEG